MLLRNGIVEKDSWRAVDDGEKLPPGNVTVTLQRFLTEREQLSAHVGVRISPHEDLTQLSEHIAQIKTAPLISVHFPAFTDGRGFSVIRLLRRRGYAGEIRAEGKLLPDQFAFLLHCGADTVHIADGDDANIWLREVRSLSLLYQSGYAQTPARNILQARAQANCVTVDA